MPLWHDRRPERPQQAGGDRDSKRDTKRTDRTDAAQDKKNGK